MEYYNGCQKNHKVQHTHVESVHTHLILSQSVTVLAIYQNPRKVNFPFIKNKQVLTIMKYETKLRAIIMTCPKCKKYFGSSSKCINCEYDFSN